MFPSQLGEDGYALLMIPWYLSDVMSDDFAWWIFSWTICLPTNATTEQYKMSLVHMDISLKAGRTFGRNSGFFNYFLFYLNRFKISAFITILYHLMGLFGKFWGGAFECGLTVSTSDLFTQLPTHFLFCCCSSKVLHSAITFWSNSEIGRRKNLIQVLVFW